MTDPTGAARPLARLPTLIVALGLTAIAILVGSDHLRRQADDRGRAWLRAIDQVEVDIAISHLWLEEHVSGDRVDLEELDERLARAGRLATSLRVGDRAGVLALTTLDDPRLTDRAAALDGWIDEFRSISAERLAGFAAGQPVGIGSTIDERYDAVFAEVFGQSQALGAALGARLDLDRRRATRWFAVLVASWGGLILATALALHRLARRRRLAERALATSRDQLLAAQKIEAVGRLAGGLAHDLNNYLGAIRGHCELAARRPEQAERVAAKMERVLTLTGKASSLIDRLHDFAQQRPPQREPIDLAAMLDELRGMIRPTLGPHVRLEVDTEPALPSVAADPAQLEQVLVNLVLNARDAMPEGGTIRLSAARSGSDAVRLAVADEGVGISDALRPRIFEPLVSTKEGAHSGLGLAIVHQIVTAHQGRIEVESAPGSGTVFRIDLPASEARPVAVAPSQAASVAATPRGHELILLVDDNDDFREATQGLLEELGYRVHSASGGREALGQAAAIGEALSLLITDVVMPGMGGRRLADELRRDRDLKVLFLSGHSETVLGREGVGPGEAQMMKSIITGDSLGRRVRALLDG